MAVERKRDGTPKAFAVKETQYLESDTAFLKRILGGRKGRSSAILVMNDEAHHAYRRGSDGGSISTRWTRRPLRPNAREATVWIEGLDRINKVLGGRGNGIRLCVDLSATPFYIQGSGNEVGQPFPWVVSDFSLLEAIEAGLVKVPQLPTEDGSGEEVPRYFNIWRWVQKQAQNDGHIGPVTVTEVMRYATAPIIPLAAELAATRWRCGRIISGGATARTTCRPSSSSCAATQRSRRRLYAWLAEGDAQYGAGVPRVPERTGQ